MRPLPLRLVRGPGRPPRPGRCPSPPLLRLADLLLDIRRHRVERSGQPIHLTPKQFGILEVLLRNVGIPVSRSQILEEVWGYGFETQEGAIDVHINALRKKIDANFETPLIQTVPGVGYMAARDPGSQRGA